MRRALPALLLATLLAPLASADAPLAGRVRLEGETTLEGALEALAPRGMLTMGPGTSLVLAWSSAEGFLKTSSGTRTPTTQTVADDVAEEPLSFGAGQLALTRCADGCDVLLWSEGEGAVGLAGEARGALVLAETWTRREPALATRVSYRAPETWLEPPLAPGAAPLAQGRVLLYLWNATARVDAGDASRDVWTGETREPVGDPLVPASRYRRAELVLELADARVLSAQSPDAWLAAPRLDLALDGTLRAERATGSVSLGRRTIELRDDPLGVEGREVRVRAAPLALAGHEAELSGRADRVHGGVATLAPPPAAATVAPAVGGALALLLLALLLAGKLPLSTLYSRLTPTNVLDNENRVRVYAHIRENPGTHVAAISRATGIGRVVVQHHLRMLETQRLVTPRRGPKLLTYFAADALVPREELAARDALRDEARRRVARAVLASPAGATVADVEARVGMSRRLVSYHLAKLERAGLVRREGFLPSRYVARDALPRALPALVETVGIGMATDGIDAATDGIQR